MSDDVWPLLLARVWFVLHSSSFSFFTFHAFCLLSLRWISCIYIYIYSANIKLRKNFIKNFRMEIVSILKDRNFCENRETVQIHIYIKYILYTFSCKGCWPPTISANCIVRIERVLLLIYSSSFKKNRFIVINSFVFLFSFCFLFLRLNYSLMYDYDHASIPEDTIFFFSNR